jgi:hypothetical protein
VRFRIHRDLDDGTFHTIGVRQQPGASWVAVSRLLDTSTPLLAPLDARKCPLALGCADCRRRPGRDQAATRPRPGRDQAAKAIREYQISTYVVRTPDEASLVEISGG